MMHPKINNLVAFNATKHFSIAAQRYYIFLKRANASLFF